MISKKLNLNNVEYIVRARTLVQLNDAIERLYNCDPEISRLSEELNQSLDNVLESRLGEPEDTITAEPAIQTLELRSEPKKPAPKTPRAKTPTAQKKTDPSIVDLGNIGKTK